MNDKVFKKNNIEPEKFYQSKYEYYGSFCFYAVVLSCIASMTYFVSDCQLFGRFAIETLLPRTIIIVPMIAFFLLYRKNKDYRVMSIAAYVVVHLIMWNTIWAIYYLPDRTHASEGFIIMHLMFFAVGFCAPFKISTIAHVLLIADIIISNTFNHYANLEIMLSLGIPCLVAIVASHFFMERLYIDHYLTSEKLRTYSMYDALTGTYNRNIIRSITREDGRFAEKLSDRIGVLIFDLDFFKKVNDTYGHANGDIVLVKLAETIREMLNYDQYFIRWGGEEFVIISPDFNLEKTRQFAEDIRKAVMKSKNGVCPVTISIGVAAYDGKSYKDAIDRADRALYQAKENGRNRVEISEL